MLTGKSATVSISVVLVVLLTLSSLTAIAPLNTSNEAPTVLQTGSSSDYYVEVGDNYFDPDDIEVEPGDEIEFENIGDIDHTVTIEDTDYDEIISPGESVFVTIEDEGVYELNCDFHTGHDGTITLEGEDEDDPADEDGIPWFIILTILGVIVASVIIWNVYKKKNN